MNATLINGILLVVAVCASSQAVAITIDTTGADTSVLARGRANHCNARPDNHGANE